MRDKAFDSIRPLLIHETQESDFQLVLAVGRIATNVFLRRMHNFALRQAWRLSPVISDWPGVRFKEKRAITLEEHQRILTAEQNPERRAFYQCCWHLGGAQSDVAELSAENINWKNHAVTFSRKKTGTNCIIRFGESLREILLSRPQSGPLFPKLKPMREAHRATEFKRICRSLNIVGITLHSYRYAWAERAKVADYPERFAQEALGHKSVAVHRAYSKRAPIELPALEDYEAKPNHIHSDQNATEKA